MVEQAAVNRWVAGSSPARGAKFLKDLAQVVRTAGMSLGTLWVRTMARVRTKEDRSGARLRLLEAAVRRMEASVPQNPA